ncbi:MAG: site-specific integrase [Mycobacterium sp.]
MGKRRTAGEGGLFQRADGMWVGSVEVTTYDGKRRQKRVYGKTRKVAKAKLDDLQEKVKKGLVIHTGTTTLADWLTYWLEKVKKPNLSQSTYKFYEEAIRLHIPAQVKKVRLDAVTTQHIRHVVGEANTSRNAQRVHLVLNMALSKAVDDGVLARNVAAAVDKPDHVKAEQDTLDVAQAKTLLGAARAADADPNYSGPLLAARWSAALWTGAQPAELRGLEWNRIDFDNALFDLSWQLKQLTKTHGCGEKVDGKWPCGKQRVSFCPGAHWDIASGIEYRECAGSLLWTRPKTAAGKRAVPIAPPLVDMLRDHQAATTDQPNPHGLVWCHRDGRPIGEKQEWDLWIGLLEKAGLPRVDQYSTRHTTATLLDELGVTEDVRMQIMGQSSKIAHKAYMHVDQTRTRAALGKLAALLED